MNNFWNYYLSNNRTVSSSNLPTLETSLNAIKQSHLTDKLSETNNERIYRIATKNSLQETLDKYKKAQTQQKNKEINKLPFIGKRIWSFFKKARYIFMSLAMLALLIGYSLKGELPVYAVFATILSILLIYIIFDLWKFRKGKLTNEVLSTNANSKPYQACINDALNTLKQEKSKDILTPTHEKKHIDHIKHLFSQYRQSQKNQAKQQENNNKINTNWLSQHVLEDSIWFKCQESIDYFKQEENKKYQKIINAINLKLTREIEQEKEKSNNCIEDMKEERRDKISQTNRKDSDYSSLRRKVITEYKSKINDEKRRSKITITALKKRHNTIINEWKFKNRKAQRAINREVTLIRNETLTDEIIKKGLNDQQGITKDQLNDFLVRIGEPLNEIVKKHLAPYRYCIKNKQQVGG